MTIMGLTPGTTISPCKLVTLINRIFIATGWGSLYYTPGTSNIGIPNFSETDGSPGIYRF